MKLVFRAAARRDLRAIGDWIARDNPARADSFVAELEQKAATLIDLRADYTAVASTRRGLVHKLVHQRYAIYYRRLDGGAEILHVRHSGMRAPRFD